MTLTIQDLGALGELLGSVAVLATLVYLALQTRQNTQAIGAQLDAALMAARQSAQLASATSSELTEALVEDSSLDITPNLHRLAMYWQTLLTGYQWQRDQARRGLLPSFNERGVASAVGGSFRTYRSYAEYWNGVKGNYLPEFVDWVEEQRAKAA